MSISQENAAVKTKISRIALLGAMLLNGVALFCGFGMACVGAVALWKEGAPGWVHAVEGPAAGTPPGSPVGMIVHSGSALVFAAGILLALTAGVNLRVVTVLAGGGRALREKARELSEPENL